MYQRSQAQVFTVSHQPPFNQAPYYENASIGSSQFSVSMMSQSTQRRENPKDRFEEDYYKVLGLLGNTQLHSPQAIQDYGVIPYAKFFEQLVRNPNTERNKKWIGYFRGTLANKWSHPCLVTIRGFFREHANFKASSLQE